VIIDNLLVTITYYVLVISSYDLLVLICHYDSIHYLLYISDYSLFIYYVLFFIYCLL